MLRVNLMSCHFLYCSLPLYIPRLQGSKSGGGGQFWMKHWTQLFVFLSTGPKSKGTSKSSKKSKGGNRGSQKSQVAIQKDETKEPVNETVEEFNESLKGPKTETSPLHADDCVVDDSTRSTAAVDATESSPSFTVHTSSTDSDTKV